jgi:hypothetical protein
MARSLLSFRTLLMAAIVFAQFFLGGLVEHKTYGVYDG